MLSFVGLVNTSDWQDNNRKIKKMVSFKYVLRSIASIIRENDALRQFLQFTPFLRKLFLIAETFDNEETISYVMKILRICMENEQANSIVFQRFPNTINFIFQKLADYYKTQAILQEALVSLR